MSEQRWIREGYQLENVGLQVADTSYMYAYVPILMESSENCVIY
jgi:hypothetical protein